MEDSNNTSGGSGSLWSHLFKGIHEHQLVKSKSESSLIIIHDSRSHELSKKSRPSIVELNKPHSHHHVTRKGTETPNTDKRNSIYYDDQSLDWDYWDTRVFGPESLGDKKFRFFKNLKSSKSDENDYIDPEEEIRLAKMKAAKNASWQSILLQSGIPLIFVGFSLIYAGYILQLMRDTKPFRELRELTVMCLPLLGLKAQLELTSVARFTIHLNLGKIPKPERVNYCIADISVSMVQSILAALFSGYFAIFLVWVRGGRSVRPGHNEAWIILATALTSASVTCLLTCITAMGATFLSHKYHWDPNNFAIPIVACVGDITTLGMIDWMAHVFYSYKDTRFWVSPLVTVIFIFITPAWGYIAYQNPFTRTSLWACWFPTLTAVILGSAAGMLLEFEGKEFDHQMELYQPLVTGISGTLVTMHFCRIATMYYWTCDVGVLPKNRDGTPGTVCIVPFAIFIPSRIKTPTYLILLGIVVPAQALFSVMIYLIIPGHYKTCYGLFLVLYVLSCFIQTLILLYISHVFLNLLWKWEIDVGFYVIPIMFALGEVIGSSLLLACCHIYKLKQCPIKSH